MLYAFIDLFVIVTTTKLKKRPFVSTVHRVDLNNIVRGSLLRRYLRLTPEPSVFKT